MKETTFAGESRPASLPPIHVEQVQLDLLTPDPDQIRKHFDQESLQSLAESIRQNGLIQPIVVRPEGEGQHKIIAGERRYRAARMAGIESVPVIVREDLVDADIAVIQVLENLQREDLSLAETCAGVAKLVEAIGFQKTCEQLGKSEAWVSKHASVVKLPDPIKALVGDGKIESVDVAKDLGSLYEISPKKAEALIHRIDPTASHPPGDRDEEDAPPKDNTTVWVKGEHKKWKNLTPDEREAYQLKDRKYEDRSTPTRSEIRLELVEAKVLKQRAADRRAEKKKAGGDPSKAKKDAAAKSKQDRERERIQAIEKHNEAARLLGYELTKKLNVLAGFKEPSRGTYRWKGDICIEVESDSVSTWSSNARAPSTPMEGSWTIDGSGTFAEIQKVAALVDPEPKLEVRLSGEISIVEAKKLAAVLGTRVRFAMRKRVTGQQLQKLVDKTVPAKTAAARSSTGDATVARFLKECVRISRVPARRIKAADLHTAYVTWSKAESLEPIAINAAGWGAAIEAAGIAKVRSNGYHYVGIELVKS